MIGPAWIRQSALVARAEWRRDEREFARTRSGPAFGLAVAAVAGWFAHAFGSAYLAAELSLPIPP
ncbi:hypothetical protein [Halovivax cerinus]|uniref:Uncharacterized protein n=1 Tax=Halovivax cerinus TaxID=1487865 RepID=A0ABD5NR28_9EURY|nr:hypothetical protein [Halovivax cerinus]